MPRAARYIVPDVPHHVVQRGNRRQRLFYCDSDRRFYIEMLAKMCAASGTECLAWCLMDNHVHLILVPRDCDGLRAPLSRLHTVYSQRINRAQGQTGHLFEGRFKSYPMDDAHLMVAVRYIENNPVAAGMVDRAEDWAWSSARAHIHMIDDRLTNVAILGQHIANWRAMLLHGLEAAGEGPGATAIIETALRSGIPLGDSGWRQSLGVPDARPRGRPHSKVAHIK
ncbi:MAG: transposase [Sphingopyxis sp.]